MKNNKGILLQPCVQSKCLNSIAEYSFCSSSADICFYIFFLEQRAYNNPLFLLVHPLPASAKQEWLCRSDNSFHNRFSVQVCRPVDEVEGSEEDGEHYPRHLVYLADAVVGLLGVDHFALRGSQLQWRGVGDGGDGHVLGEVGGVVDACRANVVGLLRQHHGVSFLKRDRLHQELD